MFKFQRIEILYYAADYKFPTNIIFFFDNLSNFPVIFFDLESNFQRSIISNKPTVREEGNDLGREEGLLVRPRQAPYLY